jgi:hypothetical protein
MLLMFPSIAIREIDPCPYDIFAIQEPDQNKYPKNNVEVGDIHQPLQ